MYKPIKLTIQIEGGDTILLSKEYHYEDLDQLVLSNDSLSYRLAEMAQEEVGRLTRLKFLEENPEFYSDTLITPKESVTPI